MKAIILAAGIGRRLANDTVHPPKALLSFDGRSLLRRHVENLATCGVTDISVVVGYAADLVREELDGFPLGARVETIFNPDYRTGSVVSLWTARDILSSGETVVLMDADVLYDPRIMSRLTTSAVPNCFLVDRDFAEGDEPVKLCIRQGEIVDFRKRPTQSHEWHGESVGFFRFTQEIARDLARRTDDYVTNGRSTLEYEEPIRDMILELPPTTFGFEDITGLPWTEIDFPEDVVRARDVILPKLSPLLAVQG